MLGQLDALADGCTKNDVATFLDKTVFTQTESDPVYGPSTGLTASSNALTSKHFVSANPSSLLKVTQLKPGDLYYYY